VLISRSFEMRSAGNPTPVLLTGQIERLVRSSGCEQGLVHVFLPGSGAALVTLDCPGGELQPATQMIQAALAISEQPDLLSNWLGTSQIFPVLRQQLHRATWQEILLVDFKPEPRWHQIQVQISGEAP